MESIKYSDLVIDDGAIQKLISELGQLRQTYERDVQAIIAASRAMKDAINGVGGSGADGGSSPLVRQASEVEKLKAKYDDLNERYRKNDLAIEQYKARIAELQQQMKAEAKAQLENSQNARQAAESYNRLAALYTKLKIELNKYSQEEISNNKVLLDKQKQAEATMEKMKALQAATGRHTLDVGNYSKALNGLGLATQQIVREAPSLAMSFNQFFLAISNNIPIFTDAFKRVKEEMGSTRIALMQTLKSLFSWQTAMVLGLTLLSKFGNEIIKWAGSVLGFGKAFDAAAEGLKAYNETMSKVSGQMAESSAELETYIYVLENGNKTEAEQAEIVQLVNEKYARQIEYLGLNITDTQSLIDAKDKLINVLVREAEARGVLNKITELSGKIAERETSEELKNLRGAVERTSATFSQMQVALNGAFGGAAGQGMQSAHIAMTNAQKDLENYNKETEVLIDHLGRLRDKALEINWGTLLGGDGGGGKGGKGGKSVRNRDLEFIRAAQDAAPAKLAEDARVLRDVGLEVGRPDVVQTQDDEHQYHRNLQYDDEVVEARAALRTASQQQRQQHHDAHRGDVDNAALGRTCRPLGRQVPAHAVHQDAKVLAPRDAHRQCRHGIFQHQVPADNPRHQFAHRQVRIGVGAARDGNHRGKLGVAEAREGAGDGREHKTQRDGRSGMGARHDARHAEQARADDDADAQCDEAPWAQHAAQALAVLVLRLAKQGLDGLFDKQIHRL